ncbi:MAG TPA: hypothetical protein VGA08_01420, partial [Candidatus Saccharimonadales bacterium]
MLLPLKNKIQSGQSLLEVIVATALFSLVFASIVGLSVDAFYSTQAGQENTEAVFLAKEGLEAAKSNRDNHWLNLVNGDHGLKNSSGFWEFDGTAEIIGDFTRKIIISDVERDVFNDIVASGGTVDPRTKQVTAEVSWTTLLGISRTVSLTDYLTDWNVFDWTETTDTEFGAGTLSDTAVVGAGEDASVQLALAAEKDWTLAEGTLITQTTDTDFGGGTFQDTIVAGTGIPASVTGTGDPEWIKIFAGSSFFETTDTDFNDGIFNNTVVADTGDLGNITLATSPSWVSQPALTTNHLNGVACASSILCFAVGNSGTILKWDGEVWSIFSSPTIRTLNDVWMLSATDGWAVGAVGEILRWNGSSWNITTSPVNQAIQSIHCRTSSDCWAGGTNGNLLHYDGASWSLFTDTGNQTWNDVFAVADLDVWAVTGNGVIFHYDGISWSQFVDTGNETWLSVWMISATDGFVTGNGAIRRFDGVSWNVVSSPTANNLNEVMMSSSSLGWAVGAGGVIIKWNGTAWSLDSSPTSTQLNSLFVVSSSEVYAVGNSGTQAEYADHFVASGTYSSSVFDAGASADWGTLRWRLELPANTTLTAAVRTGNTAVPDGSWSAFSGELSDPLGSPISNADSRYMQYRLTLTTSDLLVAPRLDSISITYNEPAGGTFFGVKVTAANDGWSVGNNGVLARFDGDNWSSYASPTTDHLLDVDFADTDNIWAIGDKGRIIYWNGTSWAIQTSGTTRTLRAVSVV